MGTNMHGITSPTQKAYILALNLMAMGIGSPRITVCLGTQLETPDSTDPEQSYGSEFLDPRELF